MNKNVPFLFAILAIATAMPRLSAHEPSTALGPLRFEENRGQTDASVRYLARARGQQVFLTDGGIVLSPSRGPAVHMTFERGNAAHWTPAVAATNSISYYIGNDPAKWVRNAPAFDRIVAKQIYAGVDLVLYGREDCLEYDLLLAPGADPRQIRLQFKGATRARADGEGAIGISSGAALIRQRAPEIYQLTAMGRAAGLTAVSSPPDRILSASP
jgi:hypothetical protein